VSWKANILHPVGLVLATTGGLATVVGAGVAVWAVATGKFAALACAAFLVVPGFPLAYLGTRLRNRAARESTIFNDEDVTVHTTRTVRGRFTAPPPRPDPDDDF
jgi:hypothetical protein